MHRRPNGVPSAAAALGAPNAGGLSPRAASVVHTTATIRPTNAQKNAACRVISDHWSDTADRGSANATIFEPGAAPRKLPPPAATTTYWRPSLPRNVIGVVCAHAGSSVSHNCLPVRDSNARNRQSIVAPMKMTPPAVAMLPPRFSVPVLSNPFAFSGAMNPSGTSQTISPRLTSSATSSPNGGAEHGILVSGFQNRPPASPQR